MLTPPLREAIEHFITALDLQRRAESFMDIGPVLECLGVASYLVDITSCCSIIFETRDSVLNFIVDERNFMAMGVGTRGARGLEPLFS